MFHVKQFFLCVFLLPLLCSAQIGSTTLPVKDFPRLPAADEAVMAFLKQSPETNKLSEAKKEWFYWTNYSRTNPKRFYDSVVNPLIVSFPTLRNSFSISLKRDMYNAPSLPMLLPNINLEKVAQTFANEMADKQASPSHTSPSGSTFQSRMESIKIKFCAGENISYGPSNTVLMLVLLYIDEGVPDLGHRKSLLDKSFTEMGIGIGSYPDGKRMVIQDFSCNQNP